MRKKIRLCTRGVGTESGLKCFICGKEGNPYLSNISCFVQTKEEGEEAQKWFQGSYLDYRDFEPNWIQLKIGACAEHYGELQRLNKFLHANSTVSKQDIKERFKC